MLGTSLLASAMTSRGVAAAGVTFDGVVGAGGVGGAGDAPFLQSGEQAQRGPETHRSQAHLWKESRGSQQCWVHGDTGPLPSTERA